MLPVDPGLGSLVAFLGTVAWVVAFAVAAHVTAAPEGARRRALGQGLAGATLWLGLSATPTALGWFAPGDPLPAVPLFLGSILGCATALALSPLGWRWATAVPLGALVAFQGFRLPLELVLHHWVEHGVVPPQMTWSGANPDIVSGVLALLLAWPAQRHRGAAWVAWGVGALLLINVVRVVVQSFNTPLQRYDEPVMLAFAVPTVWIATVCVAGAWAGHLLLLRRLVSPAAAALPAGPAPGTAPKAPSPPPR